jgi:hypothetical protein
MQLRGEVFNLSFIFVHRLVTGTGRGFKHPQLHLARRYAQCRADKVSTRTLALLLAAQIHATPKQVKESIFTPRKVTVKSYITMTEQENRVFSILKYLNQGHVRNNSTLTEEALRSQFDFTNHDYEEAFNTIETRGYIYRRENAQFIVISRDGEIKYNELFDKFRNESSWNFLESAKTYQNVTIVISILTFLVTLLGSIFVCQQNKIMKRQNEIMLEQNEIMRQQNRDNLQLNKNIKLPTDKKLKLPTEKNDSIIKK